MDYSDLPTKALSIRNPWAFGIVYSSKRIENRSARWKFRGPICIHISSYEPNAQDWRLFNKCAKDAKASLVNWPTGLEKGARHGSGIIGTAEIVDCVDQSDDPWFFGPFGLVLENVKPVEFIPVKGALGLFDWRKNL